MFSTLPGQGMDSLQCTLPKGIWLSFDFDDSHPVCMTVHIDMLWFSIFSAHVNTFHSFLFFFFFSLISGYCRIYQLYICKEEQLFLWVLLISMLVNLIYLMT